MRLSTQNKILSIRVKYAILQSLTETSKDIVNKGLSDGGAGLPANGAGLTEELVRHISAVKNEPAWMLEKRLAAFELYQKTPMPRFGPSLGALDLENMIYFVDPDAPETDKWAEVPKDIADTFEKLGIPKAEREYLGGVGAQYDSGVVYHRLKQSLADKGVIFENMDVALEKYPDLVQKYFMTDCVPAKEHKFTMLHGAAWSGGTFIFLRGLRPFEYLQSYSSFY